MCNQHPFGGAVMIAMVTLAVVALIFAAEVLWLMADRPPA
jgi:hypothetical protein